MVTKSEWKNLLFYLNVLYYIGIQFQILLKTKTINFRSMMNVTLYSGTAMKIMRVLFSFKRKPLKSAGIVKNVHNSASVLARKAKVEKHRPILPMSYYMD